MRKWKIEVFRIQIIALEMPDKMNRTTAMFSATFPKEIQVADFLWNNNFQGSREN